MKRSKEINMMSDSMEREAGISPDFLPFVSQPDLPGLPVPARCCLRCGMAIPAPKRNGRPRSFCSDECRRAQVAEQRAAWVADNPVEAERSTMLSCWTCGATFPAPPPGRGRLPRFCGAACRQASRSRMAADKRLRRARIGGGRVESPTPPDP